MDIRIDKLGVAYGQQRVIDGLSLAIPSGSFFTLLGPSGCGKTTLLRTVAGFNAVAEGRLWFGTRDVTNLPAHQRDIGMVFQDYALFPNRTVFDNAAYGLRARKVTEADIRRRVGAALERVGLSGFAERLPAALSGGQRQRVALARAMVIEPQLLLMDEPLSNLDAKLRVQVRETIAELQREAGITTIFVTHDQDEALALSTHIAVMKQGRIEQLGPPRQVYEQPATPYVADFVGGANLIAVDCAAQPAGTVQVALGTQVLAARAPAALQGKATLVVRPEHVLLTASGEGLAGRVRSLQYLGEKTSYRIELDGGAIITADLHGHHGSFAGGDAVRVRLDPERTLALAA